MRLIDRLAAVVAAAVFLSCVISYLLFSNPSKLEFATSYCNEIVPDIAETLRVEPKLQGHCEFISMDPGDYFVFRVGGIATVTLWNVNPRSRSVAKISVDTNQTHLTIDPKKEGR